MVIKYKYCNEIYDSYEEAEEAVQEVSKNSFDDYLNEAYNEVDICGSLYSIADIMKHTDPIKYRCALADYSSYLLEEIEEIEVESEPIIKYRFNGDIFDDYDDVEDAVRDYAEETFDDYFNDNVDTVYVEGWDFEPAEVIKLNYEAYQDELNIYIEDLLDQEVEEIEEYD